MAENWPLIMKSQAVLMNMRKKQKYLLHGKKVGRHTVENTFGIVITCHSLISALFAPYLLQHVLPVESSSFSSVERWCITTSPLTVS